MKYLSTCLLSLPQITKRQSKPCRCVPTCHLREPSPAMTPEWPPPRMSDMPLPCPPHQASLRGKHSCHLRLSLWNLAQLLGSCQTESQACSPKFYLVFPALDTNTPDRTALPFRAALHLLCDSILRERCHTDLSGLFRAQLLNTERPLKRWGAFVPQNCLFPKGGYGHSKGHRVVRTEVSGRAERWLHVCGASTDQEPPPDPTFTV